MLQTPENELMEDVSLKDKTLSFKKTVMKLKELYTRRKDKSTTANASQTTERKLKELSSINIGLRKIHLFAGAEKYKSEKLSLFEFAEKLLMEEDFSEEIQDSIVSAQQFILDEEKDNSLNWAQNQIRLIDEEVKQNDLRHLVDHIEVDEEKEILYERTLANWLSLSIKEGGFQKEFCRLINSSAYYPKTPLRPERYPSLRIECQTPELKVLEGQVGRKFTRPIILMNPQDFRNFYSDITGSSGGSGGANLDIGGISMIVVTNNPGFIEHELRHSLDPHLHTRKGEDNLLGELAAFYGDIINEKEVTTTTTSGKKLPDGTMKNQQSVITRTPKKVDGNRIGITLKTDTYYDQCSEGLTKAEYFDAVDKATSALDEILKTWSKKEVNALLYNVKTIQQLVAFSKLKK